jgi:aminopeptidase N
MRGLWSVCLMAALATAAMGGTGWEDHCPELMRAHDAVIPQIVEGDWPPPAVAGQEDFDALHYVLNLIVDDDSQNIYGDASMQAQSTIDGLTNVVLNFYDNMDLDSVKIGSTHLGFTRANNLVDITLDRAYDTGEEFTITMFYWGHPQRMGMFNQSFVFGYHMGTPVIYSVSCPYYSGTWWPCKDLPNDKATVEMLYTVDEGFVAAGNGRFEGVVNKGDGVVTYRWNVVYPISPYLVMISVTNYSQWSDWYYPTETVPMEIMYFAYPEDSSDAAEDFSNTLDHMDVFVNLFGEYPFLDEKYGICEFGWTYAGMEHQTLTSIGSGLITGSHTYEMVLVHELSHMWWGDMVTVESWPHVWLHEGFATYCEALYREAVYGKDDYHYYMDHVLWRSSFPGPIYDPVDLFNITVYNKGAWVLHMLRHVVGDESMWNIFDTYRALYEYGNANTDQYQAICEAEHGGDLDWFFQEWIYGENRPRYEWAWSNLEDHEGHHVVLNIDQVQTNAGLFTMPIDILIEKLSGDTTVVVWNDAWSQYFDIVLEEQLGGLQFDPENWILKHDEQVSPKVTVGLSPESTVIPRGGTLRYTATVTNQTDVGQNFEAWTEVTLPNGKPYPKNPVVGPVPVHLGIGKSKQKTVSHKVPNNAPLGECIYTMKIGEWSGTMTGGSSFRFTIVE